MIYLFLVKSSLLLTFPVPDGDVGVLVFIQSETVLRAGGYLGCLFPVRTQFCNYSTSSCTGSLVVCGNSDDKRLCNLVTLAVS